MEKNLATLPYVSRSKLIDLAGGCGLVETSLKFTCLLHAQA
jgi:hypothetical protein